MIKVMEYMALERPIVAYDLPETRVSAGESALYVPPNDPQAFAGALALLARDPDRAPRRWARLAAGASRRSLAWSHSAPPLLQVYEDLLPVPRPRRDPSARRPCGRPARMIHPTALVECDDLGAGTRVWAFAHVLQGASVGEDCNIGGHCFVESGAVIRDRVTVKNGTSVWEGVTLGDDVFVGPRVSCSRTT